ncbi:MAG: PQQ-binding-like beta-propeller repeat protein [Acidobacteria bacterium]|nr:PQQ-binding-like beta-propeller repeat protein [Acidobacteriota bacterium]MBI3656025.1 PQQ-binding-like beta-propeller repeat protein [Acidobacteriota bacterium]
MLSRCLTYKVYWTTVLILLISSFALKISFSEPTVITAANDVLTFHGDNSRTGWYADETILTLDNVNPDAFGKLWERDLGGQVYGQPLFVHNVMIRGRNRDVIYAATMTNRVHAIDATTGEWLWPESADSNNIDPRNFGTYLGPTSPYFVGGGSFCQDVIGPVGILSTVAIDPVTNALFVVSITNNRYRTIPPSGPEDEHFFLHSLDLRTGRERTGWPVEIRGSTLGRTFSPRRASQRGALLITNGRVYIPFGSRCDIRGTDGDGYHGFLFGYSTTNPSAAPYVFSPAVAQSGGGIWGPGGVSADSQGNIFVVTGNGDPPPPPGVDYSMSIMRLPFDLRFSPQTANFYTPANQATLNRFDWDLGGSTATILPIQSDTTTPNLIVTGGKDGRVYLVNRDNLGGYGGPSRLPDDDEDLNPDDAALLKRRFWTGSEIGGIKTVPAYFKASDGTTVVFITGVNQEGRLEAGGAKVITLLLYTNPDTGQSTFDPLWESEAIATSTVPVVSSNGGDNGIVWVVDARKDIAGRSGDSTTDTAALLAYDALSGTPLYTSRNGILTANNLERDRLRDGRKFCAPIVRDGKVYVGTTGIVAYGLLGAGARRAAPAEIAEPYNLALRVDATAIASVLEPTGGGNRDVNAIRQGAWKFCTGTRGYTEYNTFDDSPQQTVYFGIQFPTAQTFNELDFQLGGTNHGELFGDGGWFATGSVRVEVFNGAQWENISGVQWNGYRAGGPSRPEASLTAPYGVPLRAFDIFKARFSAVTGFGVRVVGTPGRGSSTNAMGSCGQIRVFNR